MTVEGPEPPDGAAGEPKDPAPPDAESPEPRDAQDLGRQFSHRAAHPGETGERLGAEHDARSNFAGATVTADRFVGRDQINYITVTGTVARIRMVALTDEDLALDRRFAAPPDFALAMAAVRDRRVVLLRGADGTGRYALARRLLLGLALGEVRRLHPETDLGSLTGADLGPGGYLLADPPPQAAAKLRAFDLDRLATELGADRRLVITTTDTAGLTDPDLEPHVVDVSPPDPREVLRSHLAAEATHARALELLEDPDVTTLCRDHLRDAPPAQAVRLARLLADASEPVAETVRARLTVRRVADLERWFSGMGDLATQTLAIAVATLGGEHYDLVANSAELLTRRLEPEDQPPQESAPFGGTRSARLRAIGAHLVRSELPARHGGTAPGLVVRFEEQGLARRLLRLVWEEYDPIRPQLLNWLRLCVRSEVPTVRIRAAVATGILAAESFDQIRSAIILPWARSDDDEARDAAATALSVVAERPELRDAVTGLVNAWSADDTRPLLRATAARAWRVTLDGDGDGDGNGAQGCADALTLLEQLAKDDRAEVKEAVCTSVAEMLEYRDGAFASAALGLLTDWVSSRRPGVRVTGRLGFLLAAADLGQFAADGTWRPTLLCHAERDPAMAHRIVRLWHATLNSADLHDAAKDVLGEWARLLEETPSGPDLLGWLMGAVGFDPRTGRIIHITASRWSHAPKSKVAVLAALHARRTLR
ncbi:hypothetical protein [Actinomadura monticuli]|uniref:HEAT repeat domain-containing protein n=1 Tax=Actinomadura monticuli TaxID=3097367 RepID=A0ABV4QJS9_9ACTN